MAVLTNQQFAAIAVVAAVGGFFAWKFGKKLLTEKLNPASTNNVVYNDIIGGAGRAVTGDEHWSLGVQLWEWLNPDAVEAEKGLTATAYIPTRLRGGG